MGITWVKETGSFGGNRKVCYLGKCEVGHVHYDSLVNKKWAAHLTLPGLRSRFFATEYEAVTHVESAVQHWLEKAGLKFKE